MENIIRLTAGDLTKYTSQRSGEIKFGERILTVPKNEDPYEYIKNCDADFVLLGVPEDIGVKANFGRPGAASAWESAIRAIVNLQHNKFCKGNRLLILGHINVKDAIAQSVELDVKMKDDRKKLSDLVEK